MYTPDRTVQIRKKKGSGGVESGIEYQEGKEKKET